jgi:hypothetical protein
VTKYCSRCKQWKPTTDFCPAKSTKTGLYAYCRPCSNAKRNEWRKKNPERNRQIKMPSHLKARYGITLEEYDSIMANASGTCDICGLETNRTKKGSQLDHCHRTGKIRGVLCAKCNTALGLFDDNRETLRRAIDYLEGHETS